MNATFHQACSILPKDTIAEAAYYVEETFQSKKKITNKDREEFKVTATAEFLIEMLGPSNIRTLLDYLSGYTNDKGESPIALNAFFQRFEHHGEHVSPYHTDGQAISLVILLNDDYMGGEMTFLSGAGPSTIQTEAGSATIHGPGVVHGNAALYGVKYQLTLVAFRNLKNKSPLGMFEGYLNKEIDA